MMFFNGNAVEYKPNIPSFRYSNCERSELSSEPKPYRKWPRRLSGIPAPQQEQ